MHHKTHRGSTASGRVNCLDSMIGQEGNKGKGGGGGNSDWSHTSIMHTAYFTCHLK